MVSSHHQPTQCSCHVLAWLLCKRRRLVKKEVNKWNKYTFFYLKSTNFSKTDWRLPIVPNCGRFLLGVKCGINIGNTPVSNGKTKRLRFTIHVRIENLRRRFLWQIDHWSHLYVEAIATFRKWIWNLFILLVSFVCFYYFLYLLSVLYSWSERNPIVCLCSVDFVFFWSCVHSRSKVPQWMHTTKSHIYLTRREAMLTSFLCFFFFLHKSLLF